MIKNNKAYSYLRFSTPDQIKGDSFRRQSEMSRRYADEHGLDLDEALSFHDLGVSAFRGDNAQAGALGAFLEAVDRGIVKPGSTLLVESLDRLSRQSPYLAFRQLDSILRCGVRVVTLQDGKVYDAEKGELGFTDLMMSLLVMQRAHEESLTKSKRGAEAWKAKRDKAAEGMRKLTALCPGWLTLDKEGQRFVVDEDKAAVVRRMFEMSMDGLGDRTIARTLNEEGVPSFGKSSGWRYDYVRRILENEAVIGVYQPHVRKRVDGKEVRVPVGDPIQDYFPAIVSQEVFLKAKRRRVSRALPRGRAAEKFSNLFTGLAYCGDCGSPLHFENKGRPPKGYTYLVCSKARMHIGCHRHTWRYPEAQTHILMNFTELDFRTMFPNLYQQSQAAANEVEGQILIKEEELAKLEQGLEKLADLLLERGSSPTLIGRLDTMEQQKAALQEELDDLRGKLDRELDRQTAVQTGHDEIGEALTKYIAIERKGDPEAILSARRRLHQLLKRVVDKITFTPSTGEDGLHGIIEISFQGVAEYTRRIKVAKGQQDSQGYKVVQGQEQHAVTVLEATWPPVSRIESTSFIVDQIRRDLMRQTPKQDK
ncbi:recombinase family protein [Desulfovibrio subterraneus]|uniref:Site-specific recombinase n=1 Tax=Desulfovibrio subterraneus TaxID=2718620 RepID=A0A7J0BH13_9BACT|nr:recombinase family protein [Desulfovibrio subterraneus]GFM32374.1 site-specific recombinase [Desulfovibrio subterraneus]